MTFYFSFIFGLEVGLIMKILSKNYILFFILTQKALINKFAKLRGRIDQTS